jgi:hypothetical protein
MAAPVSKTGSASPRSEHYRRLPPPSPTTCWMAKAAHRSFSEGGPNLSPAGYAGRSFNHQPKGSHHDHPSSVHAKVAAKPAPEARTAKIKNRQQEGPTGPPNAAEADAISDLLAGRQSCRIPSAVASVTRGSSRRKKGAANETGDPLPKSAAPKAELQTRSCHSNSPGQIADCFPPGAFRNQTNDHKLTKSKPRAA